MLKNRKIFLTYGEKSKEAHFEFCRFYFSREECLYVSISNDAAFFKEYLKYLEPTRTPDGGTKFDGCGINNYTKEQAETMLKRIKADKPREYEILANWLEKVISDDNPLVNGFYIQGV